jgi:hypothetical protein
MPSAVRAILGTICAAIACGVVARPLPASAGPAGSPAPAASGVLEVRIVDAATAAPVPWANVLFADGGGALADSAGLVRLTSPAAEPLRYRVVHVAYEPSPERVERMAAGETRRVVVRLTPFLRELPAVRVTAGADGALVDVVQGRTSIDAGAASALPNPADDPFQLVRLLPGVSAEDVGSDFRLRGGGVDETLVRIDGMEVRSLFHGRDFGGVTGIVPLGIVSRLDVYPGALPAELGGKMSGAIDVALRDDGAPGTHGSLAMDVTAARGLVEHHGPGGSLFVSAREGWLHRVFDAVQDEAVVQPAYRDLLVRGVRRAGASASLRGNYLRVEDHVLFEDGIDSHFVDADYLDHFLWGGGRWLVSPRVSVEGTLFGGVSSQRRRTEAEHVDDRRSRRVGGRLEAVTAAGSHLVRVGAAYERDDVDDLLLSGNFLRVLPSGKVERVSGGALTAARATDRSAAWVHDQWAPDGRLTLDLGLRASHDTYSGDALLSPRVGAALALPAGSWLRAAWGRHAQPPSGELTGRGDLLVLSERVQRADHSLVGVEKAVGRLRVGAEAWEKRFRPLDAVVGRTLEDRVERHVISRGFSRGLDAYVRHEGRQSNWWLAYSLGRSEWTDGVRTYSCDYDALHTLAIANTYRLGPDWDVGVAYRFRTGTPYTEQRWRREEADWILAEGEFNGARLPDYHRLDVRVRRRFRFDGWEASVWGEALNLTNHDNVLWYAWRLRDADGTARADAERVARTGVPGLPSVGVEVRF